jgi:superfamily I DNA/RNA helicase
MQSASSQLSLACCQAEWLQVQAWGIRELSDYLAMPSEGREEREKMQLWDVLTTYRAALDAEGLAGPDDYARMLSELLRDNPALRLHDAVVVDNVEDASLAELRLLRQLLAWQENDLFLLGEAAQRLHPAPAACRHAGIHLEQRHFELRRDWRCAQATHDWALRVLATCAFDDLDGGTRSELGVVGHEQGEGPQVQGFADFEEELAFVSELLERWLGELAADEIAVCCREPRTLRTVQRQLEGASVPVQVLDSAVESEQAAVCLASFAQVKGLEFERVIVVDAGTQSRPSQTGLATLCQERAELLERVALYVACTRARSQLVVTYHGQAAAWF